MGKAFNTKLNKFFAIKTVQLPVNEKKLNLLKSEIAVQNKTRHPNILKLFDYIEKDNLVHLILELATTDLRELLNSQKDLCLDEPTAAKVFFCIGLIPLFSSITSRGNTFLDSLHDAIVNFSLRSGGTHL